MPDELRVQRVGEDGSPVGRVAVFGLVPGSLRFAIQHASWQEKAAVELARIGDGMRSLSMAMSNLDPELIHLLIGGKPRRGWKGHGAPPIYPRPGR